MYGSVVYVNILVGLIIYVNVVPEVPGICLLVRVFPCPFVYVLPVFFGSCKKSV